MYIYRGEDQHCLSVCFNTDAIFLHLPRCISHMLTNEKRESNVPGYRFSTHSSKLETEVICNRQPKPIKTNETSACPDVFEKLIRQSWPLETSELFVQLLFFYYFQLLSENCFRFWAQFRLRFGFRWGTENREYIHVKRPHRISQSDVCGFGVFN